MTTITNIKQKLRQYYRPPYFLQGLGLGIVLLALLFIWISLSGPKKVQDRLQNLDTATVRIDWSSIPESDLESMLKDKGLDLSVQKVPLPTPDTERFLKNTPHGKIPRVSDEGVTPFQAFRKPYSPPEQAIDFPKIALVVVDYCLSEKNDKRVLDNLSSKVSLVLNPYCNNITQKGLNARDMGHEIWLGMPMETENYPVDDPGPLALKINLNVEKNLRLTQKIMASARQYTGMVALSKPVFIQSEPDFMPILDLIEQSGLGLFISNLKTPKFVETYTQASQVPFANADVHLDTKLKPYNIKSRLIELERIARQKGTAVGVLHPVPLSVNIVAQWANNLEGKELTLVPLSAISRR